MGKGRTQRSRKRKFYGNQNTRSVPAVSTRNENMTVSEKKITNYDNLDLTDNAENDIKKLSGNRIIDLDILLSVFSILCCPLCLNGNLYLEEDSRFGMSSNLTLHCKSCTFKKAFCTSKKQDKLNEINTRFVFALRLIGKGLSAGQKLCAILNLPPFLSKSAFRAQEKIIVNAASAVANRSMSEAAEEIKSAQHSKHSITDCGVSIDGTWQRRGYSSLNGCVSAISIDTGKILDLEVMLQYCRICKKLNSTSLTDKNEHICSNHKGSASSMEPVGVYRIFERSQSSKNLRYISYYGDGDSKGYETVKDIYDGHTVEKLECIGHVQKRVGTRLRKLKSSQKGLGGKGKLTDNFINRLQNYYGIAIRSNVGNLDKMQSAVIAAFFHCCSSKTQPKHGQCPTGADSWCKFQYSKFLNKPFVDKSTGLPQNIINIVKPIYMELCNQKLLKKCLHGKTQNANESFNGVLWQILPKEVFVELQTLCLGAYIAIIQYNNGSNGFIGILNELNINPGYYTVQECNSFDIVRIADSKRHSLCSAKATRRKLRACRKKKCIKIEEKEGVSYKSGEF